MCLNDVIFNARIAELETKVDNYVGCSVRCSEKQMLKSPVKLLI